MKKTLLTCALFFMALLATAQPTWEQLGGVYYAYPERSGADFRVPEGFQPFYISHYGRHGSRWLTSDSRYEWVNSQFADKRNLTPLGREVAKRLRKIWRNAKGNGGKLTPLGARQHSGIAYRMAQAYPSVFANRPVVRACSSTSDRCRKSMEAAFRTFLALPNGFLVVCKTDSADMAWIAYNSPEEQRLTAATKVVARVTPDRFLKALFRDPAKVADGLHLMSELFTIATDMQDVEMPIGFQDVFTRQEAEAFYEQNNRRMWICNGPCALNNGIPARSAIGLWQHIKADADSAIAHGQRGADLRFGHDTNLYRLLTLLKLSGAKNRPADCVDRMDSVVPMAANLQMVFMRSQKEPGVFVAFLHNERPVYAVGCPSVSASGYVYAWDSVKVFMNRRLAELERLRMLSEINTQVGTDQAVTRSKGIYGKGSEEHGQTLPALLVPHGQNFWTPQTRATERKCVAPYYYPDSLLQGIRCSHWLVGGCTQDYGSFTITAQGEGPVRLGVEEGATPFDHADELSHPHYYGVRLPRERLRVELTALSHAALLRITPEVDGEVHIVVRPNSDEREGTVLLDTLRQRVYASNPVHRIYQGWGEGAGFAGHLSLEYADPLVRSGVNDSVVWLTFQGKAHQPIVLTAATSFTSREQADHNRMAETNGLDFGGMMVANANRWDKRFARVDAADTDTAKVRQFYGALYRASFLPREFSDVANAQGMRLCPRFADGRVEANEPQTMYMDFSMWDIYRAEMPLLLLMDTTLTANMMQSLCRMYRAGGWMPIFPCWNAYTAAMIGDHAAAVLADAAVKGVRGFDLPTAYEGVRKNAFDTPADLAVYRDGMGRRALTSYLRYGYVPLEDSVPDAFHTREQVSRTLEYAYDDFCAAQLAKLVGNEADAKRLMERSHNWQHVFNPITRWADGRHAPKRGKKAGGAFLGNTDLLVRVPFVTEGAVAHYSFYVPHDVYGLMEAMGGRDSLSARLDRLFDLRPTATGQWATGRMAYWHGNEPCHHIAYLYAWTGEPWKTQLLVHDILQTEYLDEPGGLSGNDDAGQMSAWQVFGMMGFYPVCPATPYYIIGSPSVSRVRLGRFEMVAEGVNDKNIFVQSATWNGQPYNRAYITHDMIAHGGRLVLTMGSKPNKEWGSGTASLPPNTAH